MEVQLSDGTTANCDDSPFAAGGDGEVYWSQGRTHVIKLYKHDDPARRLSLNLILDRFNVVKNDSAKAPFFSWPDAIVVAPRLGVRMPTRYQPALEQITSVRYWGRLPPERKGNFTARVAVAYRVARAVRWLHGSGLCHSDLSDKNIKADPQNAETCIIDCDGLVVPGFAPAQVYGTPRYMAPEIEAGSSIPSIDTDKHSLAVLFYKIFLLRHPLEGPKVHDADPVKDDNLAMGSKALYIEHPADVTNRPVPLPLTTALLSPRVRNLFTKAFVTGLHAPKQRPQATDWESGLLRMMDRIVPCSNPACVMKSFVLPNVARPICPWCKTPLANPGANVPIVDLYNPNGVRPGNYALQDWSIAGMHGRGLFSYHADGSESPKPGVNPVRVAHFEATSGGRWFLVNDGLADARVVGSRVVTPFGKGDRVELVSGLKILLGASEQSRAAMVQMLPT